MSDTTNHQHKQYHSTGTVCRYGISCTRYPNCPFGHPIGLIPPCKNPYCSDRNCRFYHSSRSAPQMIQAKQPSSSGSGPKQHHPKQYPSRDTQSSMQTSQSSQQSRPPQTFSKDDRQHKSWHKKHCPKPKDNPPLVPSREAPPPPTPPRDAPSPLIPSRDAPSPPTLSRDAPVLPPNTSGVPNIVITDDKDKPLFIISDGICFDTFGNPVIIIKEKVENNVNVPFVITSDRKCMDLSGNILGIIAPDGHFVSFQTIEVDSSSDGENDDELNVQLTQDMNTNLHDINTWVQSLLKENGITFNNS